VETILGFSARLYEVRQLSWRPAQVSRALFTSKALQDIRPGGYNQDTSMTGRYGAEVYIRGTVVLLDHSAATLGEDHISIPKREETLPTRSEEEQTVVMICRPNSFDRSFNLTMMTRTQ
jgi:hypothetical protein